MKWEVADRPAYSLLKIEMEAGDNVTGEAGSMLLFKGNVDIKDLLKALKGLKKSGVIEDIKLLETGITMIHFFPIQYTGDQVKVIELAKEKGYISLEDVCVNLDWAQDRALRALQSMEDSGIAKFRESILTGKQWYFPSI